MRVDEEFNLYEIMLDKQQKLVYVVCSNTAKLGLQQHQLALQRVERFPMVKLKKDDRTFTLSAPEPFYSKRRTNAAIKIQRYSKTYPVT